MISLIKTQEEHKNHALIYTIPYDLWVLVFQHELGETEQNLLQSTTSEQGLAIISTKKTAPFPIAERKTCLLAFIFRRQHFDGANTIPALDILLDGLDETNRKELLNLAFICAAEKGDQTLLEYCINSTQISNIHDALMRGASNGHVDILKKLIYLDSTPEKRQNMIKVDDYALFIAAASNGYIKVLKYLITLAPEELSNMIEAQDYSAFIMAASNGHIAVVKRLTKLSSDNPLNMIRAQNYLGFILAASNGHTELLKFLTNLAPAELSNMIKAEDYSALLAAVYNNHREVINFLYNHALEEQKKMIIVQDYFPILYVIKLAIQSENDVMAYPEIFEDTELASEFENRCMIFFQERLALLEMRQYQFQVRHPKQVFNLKDGPEAQLYFYMIRKLIQQNNPTSLSLVRNIINIPLLHAKLKDLLGFTDLHFAACSGNFSQVKQLIEAGVDLNQKDYEGQTALMHAVHGNYASIVSILLANDADNLYSDIDNPDEIRRNFKEIDCPTLWTLVKKIPYSFDPHRHVKIWLSHDPDVFMNAENQLRLVQMREACPGDKINLIYDSKLLSEGACKELLGFCSKHNIEAVNSREIIVICQGDNKEARLIDIYEDEITHINAGGNLAAASDILRWLKPIYCLGTYTDMDVKVSTRDLPPYVDTFGEILLNAGSYKNNIGKNTLIYNNDIVAVLNPQSEKIKIIQEHIIQACQPKLIQEYIYSFNEYNVSRSNSIRIETSEIEISQSLKLTPREFRFKLSSILREYIKKNGLNSESINLVEKIFYMTSVTSSTGPDAILALFRSISASTDIVWYFLPSYPSLFKAFQSSQACIQAPQNTKGGDLSWTKSGQLNIRVREEQLHGNARKIQQIWRAALDGKDNLDDRNPEKKSPQR